MSGCCERPAEAAGRVAVAEEPECPLREAMISSAAVARSTTVNVSGRVECSAAKPIAGGPAI